MVKDLTNYENDYIKVISMGEYKIYKNGAKKSQWVCQCKICNSDKVFVKSIDWIRKWSHVGCGCQSHNNRVKANKARTHGMSGTTIYKKWASMKNRCKNPNEKKYYDYGGRGITYCKEWEDFEEFYDWAINNGYTDGLSLERIDVNGNYCPDNCKWITPKEQQQNKRNTIRVIYDNKEWCLRDLCSYLNLNYKSVTSRIYQQGFSPIEAITTPFDGTLYPSSSMEKAVQKYLDDNKISYIKNKKYDGLLGVKGRKLSYDFYLIDFNILIECQGLQHIRPAVNWDGVEYFEIQKEHDKRKRQFALNNNIKLIEITPEDINNIINIFNDILVA